MGWFYAKQGRQEGPVELAPLREMLESGEVAPADLVWREGMAEWAPAESVPELHLAPSAPTGPVPGAGPAGGAVQPDLSVYQPPDAPVAHEHIPNYLVPSILTTIFCCWPLGIPSIIFAAKVDGLVARGDIPAAREASNKAKMWMWINVGICSALITIYIVFAVFVGVADSL